MITLAKSLIYFGFYNFQALLALTAKVLRIVDQAALYHDKNLSAERAKILVNVQLQVIQVPYHVPCPSASADLE